MAVYRIVLKEDPFLRERAKEVREVNQSVKKLINNMFETMYAEQGVGLAAPQIGVGKRVVVVDIGEGKIALINPEIITGEGKEIANEGCLSCPGLMGEVPRMTKIKLKALDEEGNEMEMEAEDFLARAIQHEIDHLDGVLFLDKAENIQKIK